VAFFLANMPGRLKAENPVKVLRYGSTFSYATLDPAKDFDGWFSVGLGLTETLARLDDQMRPIPYLAEAIENVGQATWKVTVRDNVTFQNGQPMTAQSVKDSLERAIKLNNRARDGLRIESLAVDDKTLTIKTTAPHPTFINALCDPFSSVAYVADINDVLVYGTGPYKVNGFKPQGNASLVRHENYWGGRPNLDQFDYVYMADPGTLTMALQSGELDASTDIPSTNVKLFQDKEKYIVSTEPTSRALFLFYNFKRPIIADPEVRRAINLAMDKETYCSVILDNGCEPAVGLFPNYLPYSGARLKGESFDAEAAKAMLDEAGYTVGASGVREKAGQKLTLTLLTYTSRVVLPMLAEAIQAQLQEIGFEVKLEIMESVEDRLAAGDFDLVLYSYVTTPLGDPQSLLDNLMRTNGAYNMGKYSDPDSDNMIGQLVTEFGQDKRAGLAVAIQQRAIDNNAFGFIGHLYRTQITTDKVRDLSNHPSDMYGAEANTDILP
jgi:peptide/nickel transport system substrate-binding protein